MVSNEEDRGQRILAQKVKCTVEILFDALCLLCLASQRDILGGSSALCTPFFCVVCSPRLLLALLHGGGGIIILSPFGGLEQE